MNLSAQRSALKKGLVGKRILEATCFALAIVGILDAGSDFYTGVMLLLIGLEGGIASSYAPVRSSPRVFPMPGPTRLEVAGGAMWVLAVVGFAVLRFTNPYDVCATGGSCYPGSAIPALNPAAIAPLSFAVGQVALVCAAVMKVAGRWRRSMSTGRAPPSV